jgi:hypothetical protein
MAPRPARVPLADVYSGSCSAGAVVDLATTVEACNFGYARGRCSAFPAEVAFDAVRFSAPRDTFEAVVEIVWILEKEYSPARHGTVHYSRERRDFIDPPEDPVLHRQALAFAASYVGA